MRVSDVLMIFIVVALLYFFYFKGRNPLKSAKIRTAGKGQHGSARWGTTNEMYKDFTRVAYRPKEWRAGKNLPTAQGIIVHCQPTGLLKYIDQSKAFDLVRKFIKKLDNLPLDCYVDDNDVHMLMIGASGIGKTANFLYPNLEYAFASGMSFITTDTKGDLYRSTGTIGEKYYGYTINVIDLRNPLESSGYNMIYLVNKYMDLYKKTGRLSCLARAEKYAKITAKTIVEMGVDPGAFGQNSYFYDSAEGIVTATLLILSEYGEKGERHIVSCFKLIQDLMAPSNVEGLNQFQVLIDLLPSKSRARFYAAAALKSSPETMSSVMSTAMSRLLTFIDSGLEQIMCFKNSINVEKFCKQRTAIYLVLPEEDTTKHFIAGLFIQQMYREMLEVADQNGGKLDNRVMFYCDELGTMPKIDGLEAMFSAARSRKISIIAIIQSLSQFEKNYGKEGAEIIEDNCQLTLFGGFAPNSNTAKVLSENLGNMTIENDSVTYNHAEKRVLDRAASRTTAMMQRQLMTTDELKNMPKGHFILMKTGSHPYKTRLKLFLEWGIEFEELYRITTKKQRIPKYADKNSICKTIVNLNDEIPE